MRKKRKSLNVIFGVSMAVLVVLLLVSLAVNFFALQVIPNVKVISNHPGMFATLFFTKNYAGTGHNAYATGQILNNLVAYFFLLSALVIFVLSFVLIKHNAGLKIKSALLAIFLVVPATLGLTGGFIDFIGHGMALMLNSGSTGAAFNCFGIVCVYILDFAYYILAIIYLVSAIRETILVNKGELPLEEEEEEPRQQPQQVQYYQPSEEEKEEEYQKRKADMLEEIRKIVREELDRLDRVAIITESAAEPEEEPVKEEEPVQEEPVEEPEEVEEEVEQPQEAGLDLKSINAQRIPFAEKIVKADKDLQEKYNELKNEILAYGATSRLSIAGDTFRLHRKAYVKITLVGKTLKVYFALNPNDYVDSPVPVTDAGDKASYAEVPALLRVRSNLSLKRAKELVATAFAQDNIEQDVVQNHNYVKDIRAELRAAKKQ